MSVPSEWAGRPPGRGQRRFRWDGGSRCRHRCILSCRPMTLTVIGMPEILAQLAHARGCSETDDSAHSARAVVNDIYRYELRLLRDRYLVGEFSKKAYYDKVVETRNRYPVMGVLTRNWVE